MLRFPAIWLRDNCPCAECLDPGSGQKLNDITELPAGLAVSAAEDMAESVVVTYAPDGFAAARELRAADRETFDLLAGTPVPFGYRDKSTELRASQPLIQLSLRGRVREIRFNNRSARPLRLPYAEVTAFYAAYRRWAELLARPERRLKLRLGPGDCLIFDNTRILHARTAFSVTGGRHLQGCYADLDGLASTLAVLRREETP